MKFILILAGLAALGFVAWALWTFYTQTTGDFKHRIVASLMLGAAALGAIVTGWLNSGAPTP